MNDKQTWTLIYYNTQVNVCDVRMNSSDIIHSLRIKVHQYMYTCVCVCVCVCTGPREKRERERERERIK